MSFLRITTTFLPIIVFSLAGFPGMVSASEKSIINFEQAIQIAEKFVASQGYTEKKITLDKENIVLESSDVGKDIPRIMQERSGILSPVAVGAKRIGNTRYVVAFRYAANAEKGVSGKGVMVSRSGKEIQISDRDVSLEGFFRTEAEWKAARASASS